MSEFFVVGVIIMFFAMLIYAIGRMAASVRQHGNVEKVRKEVHAAACDFSHELNKLLKTVDKVREDHESRPDSGK
jgi:Na+-transporting methylmalonyl-CoA/oxaloacetate decarboxylase gamma subunit